MTVMFQDKYVFAQLTAFLNRTQFNNYVRKYDGNRYVKHFTCWNQLLAMMFGQLSNRESLRDLIVAFEAHRAKQYHLGLGRKPIAKMTFASANQNRDYRIFEDFAFYMMEQARKKRVTDIFKLKGNVYAFDSTTIPLCLSVFWWAKFRKKKGGIKAHVLYALESQVPAFFHISTASVYDSKAMKEIPYESGSYYVFDRGYNAFKELFKIHQHESFFVVRAKKNLQYKCCKWRRRLPKNILTDAEIEFTEYNSYRKYPEKLRLVKFYDEEQGREFAFLTNAFHLTAPEIANLYKNRWQIELFFYEKYIVMRSERESSPENQVDTDLLLRSTSHNDNHFLSPLSQSRRFLLDSQDLSGSRLGVRSVYAFSKASRFAFESARAYMSVVCIETCPRMSRI